MAAGLLEAVCKQNHKAKDSAPKGMPLPSSIEVKEIAYAIPESSGSHLR